MTLIYIPGLLVLGTLVTIKKKRDMKATRLKRKEADVFITNLLVELDLLIPPFLQQNVVLDKMKHKSAEERKEREVALAKYLDFVADRMMNPIVKFADKNKFGKDTLWYLGMLGDDLYQLRYASSFAHKSTCLFGILMACIRLAEIRGLPEPVDPEEATRVDTAPTVLV